MVLYRLIDLQAGIKCLLVKLRITVWTKGLILKGEAYIDWPCGGWCDPDLEAVSRCCSKIGIQVSSATVKPELITGVHWTKVRKVEPKRDWEAAWCLVEELSLKVNILTARRSPVRVAVQVFAQLNDINSPPMVRLRQVTLKAPDIMPRMVIGSQVNPIGKLESGVNQERKGQTLNFKSSF